MKKHLLYICALLLSASSFSQTVVYQIPFSGLVGLELTSGDMCSAPFVVEEAKQISAGNQWGCAWTSTGSEIATSVDIEFRFTINDQVNIPSLLNGSSNNGQGGSIETCSGSSSLMAWSVNPANYVVGGSNTFLANYAASSQVNQLDHMLSGTTDIYMIVTVNYSPCTPPFAAVTTFKDVTCNGGSDGDINITVTGGTAPYTYDWDMDGTGDFDDIEDPVGLAAGTYNVVVKEVGGCTFNLSHTVGEPAPMDVTVTQSGAILTANFSGVAYQWVNCPGMGAIAGANTVSYTATANGDYAVIITDGPCVDTSTCYTLSAVGIYESSNQLFNVFPNPTSSNVSVVVNNQGVSNLSLFDVTGKLVWSTNNVAMGQTIILGLTDFENGLYVLKLQGENGSAQEIIIKK